MLSDSTGTERWYRRRQKDAASVRNETCHELVRRGMLLVTDKAGGITPMQNQTGDTMTKTTAATTTHRREANPYGGNFILTPSLMDYLAPDLTLPEQYFLRQQADDGMGPERALMYAVLKDGIRCFYKNVGATRRKYKKICAEAEEWIAEDCWDYPFSFRVICDTLGIDAECLRGRLFGWKEAELKRRELTGDKSSRQNGRSPFPSPIDLDGLDRTVLDSEIDVDVDLDQDSDLGFASGDEGEAWDGVEHISLDDLAYEERVGTAA
ncbi:MAG TPA: hypothetical protein VEL28_05310 [Candidatus Binatia bacterium]|nr:hypothetical protein [Candidatus Binatia bacterium]